MKLKPKSIVILVLIILLLIILVQNTHVVTFNILFWDISMSQFLLIGFSVIIGIIIGYLVCLLAAKKGKTRYM